MTSADELETIDIEDSNGPRLACIIVKFNLEHG